MKPTPQCRPDDPTVACDLRRAKVQLGEFSFVWHHGWTWWRATTVTDPWLFCPWCGQRLPDLHKHAIPRLLDFLEHHRQADGADLYEGEEGG